MGKQRRFVFFADGEGFTVRGVAALKRALKDEEASDYGADEIVVYEGAVGDSTLVLVNPEEV